MVAQIPVVWSERTLAHEPGGEVWVGVTIPGTEVPARVAAIRDALAGCGHRLVEATDRAVSELETVHGAGLLTFLATAEERWRAGPYVDEAGQDRVVPYLFPTPAMAGGLPLRRPTAVHAEVGTYGYDTMTLLGEGSWDAISAAAACALDAAELVLGGEPVAYALSRPPGHHATRSGYGGSCYLNNAALAAQRLRDGGHERVGVVDVDAHHGNGTAAIFYDRADVLYGSVHVDPAAGWFPHYVGFAEETGTGPGEDATRNLPLAEGTGDGVWLSAVEQLADWLTAAGCTALVVSLGVDASADDPESPLLVTRDGYHSAGRLLGSTGLPAVLVQEGGYHLPSLGGLVAAYVEGHAGG